jgi:hypothetical protein
VKARKPENEKARKQEDAKMCESAFSRFHVFRFTQAAQEELFEVFLTPPLLVCNPNRCSRSQLQ